MPPPDWRFCWRAGLACCGVQASTHNSMSPTALWACVAPCGPYALFKTFKDWGEAQLCCEKPIKTLVMLERGPRKGGGGGEIG